MTKKQLQFCIYYMHTGDEQVAYKMAYPRAAVKSLKASVSRLMARPDVEAWVKGTEERVHARLMRQFENEHYDKLKEQLLTIKEKRTVLTKIITGETKRIRYIKGKYGPQRVEEDLPVYAVLRAVDLDTRLENFYNYLTRSDTWRKAQNIYVNTPTLQQQVNILISQTGEQAKQEVQEHELSPAGVGVAPATGVDYRHGTDNTSPLEGDLGVYSHGIDNTSPVSGDSGVYSHSTDNTSPLSGVPMAVGIAATPPPGNNECVENEPVPPNAGSTPKKNTFTTVTTGPVPPKAGLTPKKKIFNRLTKVNKLNPGPGHPLPIIRKE